MTQIEKLNLCIKVNFLAVQSYLKNTGWQKEISKREHIAVFSKEHNGDFFEVLLPLNRDFGDYAKSLLNIVQSIAKIEQKEVEQTLSDLLLPPSDIIRFRVSNKDTEEGTISFQDGIDLFESSKKALYTAACDIIQPELYHKRLDIKEANQFINQCRLGQTERGSFIASIICPFMNESKEEQSTQLSLFAHSEEYNKSLTRKVTIQLMQALNLVKKSIENDEIQKIENGETGITISANFLESIVEMNQFNENGEIDISSTWSSMAPANTSIPKRIQLSKDYLPAIKSIVHRIIPKDDGSRGEFVGKISLVKAEPDTTKRKEGEISFNFIGDDEKATKAKVILNADDYRKACEAHEKGKNVIIKGLLKTVKRSKIIENPEFDVLS